MTVVSPIDQNAVHLHKSKQHFNLLDDITIQMPISKDYIPPNLNNQVIVKMMIFWQISPMFKTNKKENT